MLDYIKFKIYKMVAGACKDYGFCFSREQVGPGLPFLSANKYIYFNNI